MKKPEFPKPQLIREDFMPEQDIMKDYRIKKVTKGDGKIWYYAQKKMLGFWWADLTEKPYGVREWANGAIIEDIQYWKDDIVEYLEPDTSETVRSDPNPPPNLV